MTNLRSDHLRKDPSAKEQDDSFTRRLQQSWPLEDWIDLPVVVAVSGGSDSVALLLALSSLRTRYLKSSSLLRDATGGEVRFSSSVSPCGKLIVGHYHHGVRGSDADQDAAFVESLCEQQGVQCEVEKSNTESESFRKKAGEGWESTFREKRYAFLLRLAESHGARYVVTGHTKDDQVETILHRVIRGTGLRGLSGMPRSRPLSPAVSLIRPMLTLSRDLAQEHLTALGVNWRTDPSNESCEFTRNQIRHDLLPLLEREFNPQAATAILRLGHLASEAQEMIDEVITRALEECNWKKRGETIELEARTLRIDSEFLARELLIALWRKAGWPLQAMGMKEWQCLVKLIKEPGVATRTLPGRVVAKKEGGKLSLHRPD